MLDLHGCENETDGGLVLGLARRAECTRRNMDRLVLEQTDPQTETLGRIFRCESDACNGIRTRSVRKLSIQSPRQLFKSPPKS